MTQSSFKHFLNLPRSLTKENRILKKKIKGKSIKKTDSTSGDTITSDSSFDSDKVGDGNDQSIMMINDDQSSMIVMMPTDENNQANDLCQGNIKEEPNINHHLDFIIVEDNLSEPKLVVLDKHDVADNVVVTTNDRSTVLQISQTRYDNKYSSWLIRIKYFRAALRQMTNHRSATKPSDIKHRDRVKTVTKEHRTMLSYWSDSFL